MVGLFVRFTMQGERKEIALGISCEADRWDNQNQKVTSGDDALYINQCIANSRHTLEDIVMRYEMVEKRIPTIDDVIEEYNEREGRIHRIHKEEEPAYQSITAFIKEGYMQKGWSDGTAKKFLTLQKHLKQFNEKLTFNDINVNTLADFQIWCMQILDHRNTTLQKESKFLRWWLAWAKKKGLYLGDADEEYRPQYKGGSFEFKTIIYLEREELHKLMDLDLTQNPSLDRIRDIFVFSCYCGLRFSDVKRLKKTDVTGGQIRVVMQKTSDAVQIPLNTQARVILAKYWHNDSAYAFPVPSNQKVNEYIKVVCNMAGIDAPVTEVYFKGGQRVEQVYPKWQKITFHCSRKTFITMAFELDIPPQVIMKFSGHKKMEMLNPYMAIVEKKKQQEMAKFDTL